MVHTLVFPFIWFSVGGLLIPAREKKEILKAILFSPRTVYPLVTLYYRDEVSAVIYLYKVHIP